MMYYYRPKHELLRKLVELTRRYALRSKYTRAYLEEVFERF